MPPFLWNQSLVGLKITWKEKLGESVTRKYILPVAWSE